MRAVGIDGCRSGWLCCEIGADRTPAFSCFPDLADAWNAHHDAAAVFIDIPIGLPDHGFRQCDREAKALLGRYNSRVFLTPPRGVLELDDYADANARCRELTDGKGLAKQLWMIAPKIREADALLRDCPESRGRVRECHPEICFYGLTGSVVAQNKSTDDGERLRTEALSRHVDAIEERVSALLAGAGRGALSRDDALDACVAALAARLILESPACARTLPASPPADRLGLAMEMVYAVP